MFVSIVALGTLLQAFSPQTHDETEHEFPTINLVAAMAR